MPQPAGETPSDVSPSDVSPSEGFVKVVMPQPTGETPSDVSFSDVSPSAGFVQVEDESSLSVRSLNTDTYQFELSSSPDVDERPESVEGVDSNEVAPSPGEVSSPDVDECPEILNSESDVDSCSGEMPDTMVSGDSCSESVFDDHVVPDGDLWEEESECSDIWDGEDNFIAICPQMEEGPQMEEVKVMEMVKMRVMTDTLMLLCALILLLSALILVLDAMLTIEEIEAAEAKLLKPPAQDAQVIGSGAGISIFFVALIGAAFFARNRWVRRYSKGVL